jgi:hypothetical protein
MPTAASPDTNRFRCAACGRHSNTEAELHNHQVDCLGAKQSGSGSTRTEPPSREEGDDREWVSTP